MNPTNPIDSNLDAPHDLESAPRTEPQLHRPAPLPILAETTAMLGRVVVLDTADPIVYLGTLRDVRPDGFALEDADVHDCREGHANKELYVCEARRDGVHSNRQRVLVFREAVISMSLLEDVIPE